jgi:hypothetical protein
MRADVFMRFTATGGRSVLINKIDAAVQRPKRASSP